jgi:hypothetical protein
MAADPQRCEEDLIGEQDFPCETDRQLPSSPEESAEDESFESTIEKARRLIAIELDLAQMRGQLLEGNLKITEAQLELAERQLDQLVAENQQLRQENDSLRRRLGESA